MPANTVKVDRSTRFGNPFIGRDNTRAVNAFREWLAHDIAGRELAERARRELRGKNLACWCALDTTCHADVLLELANE
jgi:hypothetical protein